MCFVRKSCKGVVPFSTVVDTCKGLRIGKRWQEYFYLLKIFKVLSYGGCHE